MGPCIIEILVHSYTQLNSYKYAFEQFWIDLEGHFTPRGRANSLCERLEILTCDWPKGSNRSQPFTPRDRADLVV
jgi:hypothetical protein